MRRVVNGLLRLRVWQIGNCDLATDARLLLIPVREGGLTGDRLLRMERIRKKGGKGESGECVELCEV
jgi:hypothetical protein